MAAGASSGVGRNQVNPTGNNIKAAWADQCETLSLSSTPVENPGQEKAATVESQGAASAISPSPQPPREEAELVKGLEKTNPHLQVSGA